MFQVITHVNTNGTTITLKGNDIDGNNKSIQILTGDITCTKQLAEVFENSKLYHNNVSKPKDEPIELEFINHGPNDIMGFPSINKTTEQTELDNEVINTSSKRSVALTDLHEKISKLKVQNDNQKTTIEKLIIERNDKNLLIDNLKDELEGQERSIDELQLELENANSPDVIAESNAKPVKSNYEENLNSYIKDRCKLKQTVIAKIVMGTTSVVDLIELAQWLKIKDYDRYDYDSLINRVHAGLCEYIVEKY